MAASDVVVALAVLRVRYTYPLAAYLNFFPGGIRFPRCLFDGTTEAEAEAEAVVALASSDLEKKYRSHSYEGGEV